MTPKKLVSVSKVRSMSVTDFLPKSQYTTLNQVLVSVVAVFTTSLRLRELNYVHISSVGRRGASRGGARGVPGGPLPPKILPVPPSGPPKFSA